MNIQHTYIFTNIKIYTFTPIISDLHNLDEIRQFMSHASKSFLVLREVTASMKVASVSMVFKISIWEYVNEISVKTYLLI